MTEQERELATHSARLDGAETRLDKLEEMIAGLHEKFERYLPRYVTAIGVFGGMLLGGCVTIIAALLYVAK